MTATRPRGDATGVAYAGAAYAVWGLFPLYFRLLVSVPAPEILAHRIVWSAAFLVILVTAVHGWRDAATQLRRRGALPTLAVSATLISGNWLTYIWAVNAGHVLEASLGYFINPIITVLLSVAFLRERLSSRQRLAVVLAAAGVAALVVRAGRVPWIALVLATTFGLYGLLRKRLPVAAVPGLVGEVFLITPAALLFLGWNAQHGGGHFTAAGAGRAALLAASGILTAVPLIWYGAGVQRLRLSTIGLLQYVNPTIQFVIAVFVFREPFTAAHAMAFGCIWAALALYTSDAVASSRRASLEPAARPDGRAGKPAGSAREGVR